MLVTKEIHFEIYFFNSCPLCMKEEMRLINKSIITNGVGYGAPLLGLRMDSATDIVAMLHWASCLLYLCFPICGMQIIKSRCNPPHRIVGELK